MPDGQEQGSAPGDGRTWLLRADGASKRFGETTALIAADLSVAPGEAVAIMGPSGSGKSTLLHVLAGIFQPDSGRVLFQDPAQHSVEDLAQLDDDERSAIRLRRFGFVFQQGMLLEELTAVENVYLPLLLARMPRTDAQKAADDTLTSFGLEGLGQRRIGQLSGGQAQRVAIARATVTQPTVVFADEPTGALDSHTADEVLTVLLDAGRSEDRALLVVTHDEHVASRCDRIVRLRDGRIQGNG